MSDRLPGIVLLTLMAVCGMVALEMAVFRPAYFSSSSELGTLLFLQVLLASIWSYRARFMPVLLAVFLWAGMAMPLNMIWTSGRWFVLAAGALAGLVAYMRDPQHYFSRFHFVAFSCVAAAMVSAEVSAYPNLAVLKALSLLLLFLYGSFGARLAAMGREAKFIAGLLLGCELLVYFSAVAYLVLRQEIFDNPNSLGAVMGVASTPVMLWGILVSEKTSVRYRRAFAFLLSLMLLFSSYARAGFAAAAISCVLLCVALRRYRLLIKGMAVALLLAALAAAVVPLPDHSSESLASVFLYKGRRQDGILGSRKSVWDRTVAVIQEHPWFGSGFGTSLTGDEVVQQFGTYESAPQARREHGNSYLEITEWVGFLGDIPFFALLVLVAVKAGRVFLWMRRTGSALSPAVPLAAVLVAGLVHAAFEDWLFAAGYYLCVFFWALAFILVDILPPAPKPTPCPDRVVPEWANSLRIATAGR
jgi:O-antigen ligase